MTEELPHLGRQTTPKVYVSFSVDGLEWKVRLSRICYSYRPATDTDCKLFLSVPGTKRMVGIIEVFERFNNKLRMLQSALRASELLLLGDKPYRSRAG